MALLRSGLVLFITVTALAATIVNGVFFGQASLQGWLPSPSYVLWLTESIAVITGPTCLLLMLLASRGRRRPALDGAIIIAVLLLAICSAFYVWASNSHDPLGASYAGFWWGACVAGFASIIPAHLLCYFALRRSPLLRGLAPKRSVLKTWPDQHP